MIDLNCFDNFFDSRELHKSSGVAHKTGIAHKTNRAFWSGLGCWSTYNLVDAGLARFFALETLTHGTGPLGYIGINLNGADPNYGGSKIGSSVGAGDEPSILNSRNFFHVFKDSEFPAYNGWVAELVIKKIAPRAHAILSGMATFGYSFKDHTEGVTKGILGGISGLLTPTLKFKFIPEEVVNCTASCRFEEDSDYGECAYRTSRAIPAHHLGVLGSLTQGINAGMFSRMASNPEKVLIGVALLGIAALVAKVTYGYMKHSQPKVEAVENPASGCRKKIKKLFVGTCWVTLALTNIFLNTL